MISSFTPRCVVCNKKEYDFTSRKHTPPHKLAFEAGWRITTTGKWKCPKCRTKAKIKARLARGENQFRRGDEFRRGNEPQKFSRKGIDSSRRKLLTTKDFLWKVKNKRKPTSD